MTGGGPAAAGLLVESVSVLGVRNLADAPIALGPGINLVWGANGAGKTNLLEATYMALAGRSCRTRDDRETIAFGQSLARSEAVVSDGDRRTTFLLSVSRAEGRRQLVDGTTAGAGSAEQRPPLSVFMPDRLSLVKGAPTERRNHLDRFSAALWPSRADQRRRYARALAQRNALLGRIRAGIAAPASLDAWDAELAAAGIELARTRRDAIARLAGPFTAAADELGLAGGGSIAYRPRSDASEPGQLAAELAERRDSDVARGYTGWGPHLDEVAIDIGARAARRYGSQGQQRLALLALLFAEREALVDDGRPAPLMLLDDVTSELDAERRSLLVDRLGEAQALITATEPDQLPAAGPRREIAMREGRALTLGDEAAA
jgi:DNA replication and repair protein RecF